MKNLNNFTLKLVVILLPIIITVGLLIGLLKVNFFDFYPYYNDEIHYWHATLTFNRVGFNGGYYVIDEVPAPARFSHFGPHGPMFPAIYGLLAHVVGWQLYSGPLLNLGLVTLALCIFIFLTLPDQRHLKIMLIFLPTFWSMILLLPTNMQQSLNQAISITLAGLFYRFGLEWQRKNSKLCLSLWLIASALVGIASVLRFTWSIIFLPLLLSRIRDFSRRELAVTYVQAIGTMVFFYLVSQFLAAPNPNSVVSQTLLASTWQEAIYILFQNTALNLKAVLLMRGHPLEVALIYQSLFFVALDLRKWIGNLDSSRLFPYPRRPAPFSYFHLANLGLPLLLILVFYQPFSWGGFRTLAPHLTLSVLLLIFSSRSRAIWLIIITNMLLVFSFAKIYKDYRMPEYNQSNRIAINTIQTQLEKFLVYRKSANPWCNTLLVDVNNFPPEFAGAPAGIGISVVFDWDRVRVPLKSQFVLLDQDQFQWIRSTTRLKLLTHTRIGDLWLNLDSQCR